MTEDFKEIFNILNPYMDYYNCDFLAHIVKEFGTSELQRKMKMHYIEGLECFEKYTSIESFAHIRSVHKEIFLDHFVKLVLQMNWNAAYSMLYEVRKLKNAVANVCNLNR